MVSLVLKVSTFKPDVSLKQCFKTHDSKKIQSKRNSQETDQFKIFL